MSRRSIVKKRYPTPDPTYNSLLVSLLTARILKSGKKIIKKPKNFSWYLLKNPKTYRCRRSRVVAYGLLPLPCL